MANLIDIVNMDPDILKIKEAYVNQGPVMVRAPNGRA